MDDLILADEGLPFLVIVTGSRKYTTAGIWIDLYEIEMHARGMWGLMHGACPDGADRLARAWWQNRARSIRYMEFPAAWETHGKSAGPRRNQEMVDEALRSELASPICLAYPLADSRGTFDMMRRVEKAGIPLYVRSDI